MGRRVRGVLGGTERGPDGGGGHVNESGELAVLLLGLIALGIAAGLYLAEGAMP